MSLMPGQAKGGEVDIVGEGEATSWVLCFVLRFKFGVGESSTGLSDWG